MVYTATVRGAGLLVGDLEGDLLGVLEGDFDGLFEQGDGLYDGEFWKATLLDSLLASNVDGLGALLGVLDGEVDGLFE